jgi:hypothetical protein
MADTVFLLTDDGELKEMTGERYDSADLLRRLLEDHPGLLSGARTDDLISGVWVLADRKQERVGAPVRTVWRPERRLPAPIAATAVRGGLRRRQRLWAGPPLHRRVRDFLRPLSGTTQIFLLWLTVLTIGLMGLLAFTLILEAVSRVAAVAGELRALR